MNFQKMVEEFAASIMRVIQNATLEELTGGEGAIYAKPLQKAAKAIAAPPKAAKKAAVPAMARKIAFKAAEAKKPAPSSKTPAALSLKTLKPIKKAPKKRQALVRSVKKSLKSAKNYKRAR